MLAHSKAPKDTPDQECYSEIEAKFSAPCSEVTFAAQRMLLLAVVP